MDFDKISWLSHALGPSVRLEQEQVRLAALEEALRRHLAATSKP